MNYVLTKMDGMNEEQSYVSYGIGIMDDGCVKILIEDISPDRDAVEDLVCKCRDLDAAPEHILDIVYDWIG